MLIKKPADIRYSEVTPKSVYLDRRKFLAGNADHLLKRRPVRDHIDLLVLDVVLVEPADGFMAPAAVGFDEEAGFQKFSLFTEFVAPCVYRCESDGQRQAAFRAHFEAECDGFLDVFQRLWLGFPLADTTGNCRTLGHPNTVLITFQRH